MGIINTPDFELKYGYKPDFYISTPEHPELLVVFSSKSIFIFKGEQINSEQFFGILEDIEIKDYK